MSFMSPWFAAWLPSNASNRLKKFSNIKSNSDMIFPRRTFSIRLTKLYGQSGMFENAKKVFNEMSEWNCERSVKSWNALLSACVNLGKLEEIEGIFREMEMKWKLRPDVVSYNIVIKRLCEMGGGGWDKELGMVDEMERSGVKLDLTSNYDWVFELCKEVFERKRLVDARLLQNVVDGLTKDSRIEEAKMVV
ncbi:unnamed protein product [Fraxinus pennsylvanica]|uniref:Pentatricopeptide repeat-containing protein n=1 Tax=Fraxinus pennsylvanica TaxID=56036 RepID=A0AAD2E7X0_9LAMI|nr:unnamed protein product [Fraxinus pennsylvanica]